MVCLCHVLGQSCSGFLLHVGGLFCFILVVVCSVDTNGHAVASRLLDVECKRKMGIRYWKLNLLIILTAK